MILMSVLSVGCNSELEDVTITSTNTDYKYGYTTVEFPNGQRKWRMRIFGEVGDEFKAKRAGNEWR